MSRHPRRCPKFRALAGRRRLKSGCPAVRWKSHEATVYGFRRAGWAALMAAAQPMHHSHIEGPLDVGHELNSRTAVELQRLTNLFLALPQVRPERADLQV